jgi:hypothetical protein
MHSALRRGEHPIVEGQIHKLQDQVRSRIDSVNGGALQRIVLPRWRGRSALRLSSSTGRDRFVYGINRNYLGAGAREELQPVRAADGDRGLRAEAAVGKAGIKMLFPIVIFILPVLFVITLVPGMLSVLRDLKMLGAGR